MMDLKLLALTLNLQKRCKSMTQSSNLEVQYAAADTLDYLGEKIDQQQGKDTA